MLEDLIRAGALNKGHSSSNPIYIVSGRQAWSTSSFQHFIRIRYQSNRDL